MSALTRTWRTLVVLVRYSEIEVLVGLPGWDARLFMVLKAPEYEDEALAHAVPKKILEAVPQGKGARVHCKVNIGAEHHDDLMFPTDPDAWEDFEVFDL